MVRRRSRETQGVESEDGIYIYIHRWFVKGTSYLFTLFPYVINRRSIESVYFRSGVSNVHKSTSSPLSGLSAQKRARKGYVGRGAKLEEVRRPLIHLLQELQVSCINNRLLIYRALSRKKRERRDEKAIFIRYVYTRLTLQVLVSFFFFTYIYICIYIIIYIKYKL